MLIACLDVLVPYFFLWMLIYSQRHKLPYSPLAQVPRDAEVIIQKNQENLKRQGEDYFLNLNLTEHTQLLEVSSGDSPDLEVLVFTRKRKNDLGYLTRTMAELHRQAKVNRLLDKVQICSVDEASNSELDSLRPFFPVTEVWASKLAASHVQSRRGRQKGDVAACMTSLTSTKPNVRYILMLEDDTVIKDDFFVHLLFLLRYLELKHPNAAWLDLKLYFPPKWSGFGLDAMPIIDLIICTLALGFSVHFSLHLMCWKLRRHSVKLSIGSCIFNIGLAGATLLLLSRQQLLEFRLLHHQLVQLIPVTSCCTPAVVYNARELDGLAIHLFQDSTNDAMDLVVSSYREMNNLSGYLARPNLVEHIGYISNFEVDKDVREFIFQSK